MTDAETALKTLTGVCHGALKQAINGSLVDQAKDIKSKILMTTIGAAIVKASQDRAAIGFDPEAHQANRLGLKRALKVKEKFDELAEKDRHGFTTKEDAAVKAASLESLINENKAKKEQLKQLDAKHEAACREAWKQYKNTTAQLFKDANSKDPAVSSAAKSQLAAKYPLMVEFDELRRSKTRIPKAGAHSLAVYLQQAIAELAEQLQSVIVSDGRQKIDIPTLLCPQVLRTQFMRLASFLPSYGVLCAWVESNKDKKDFPIKVSTPFLGALKKLLPKKSKKPESAEGYKASQNARIALAAMAKEIVQFFCGDILPSVVAFSGKKTIDNSAIELAITTATGLIGGPPAQVVSAWASAVDARNAEKQAKKDKAASSSAPASAPAPAPAPAPVETPKAPAGRRRAAK